MKPAEFETKKKKLLDEINDLIELGKIVKEKQSSSSKSSGCI